MKSQKAEYPTPAARKTNKPVFILAALTAGAFFIAATALPPVKIILIGDSITQGENYNYRYILWNRLLDSGYTDIDFVGNAPWGSYRGGFKWNHESWGGYTTGQVLASSAADIASLKPDIAVIHLGTNDIAKAVSLDTAIANLGSMISNLRNANASVSIILSLIPRANQTWTDAFVSLAARTNSPQSPVIIADTRTGWDASTHTYDNTHPGTRGCEKMVGTYFPLVTTEILKRTSRGTNRVRQTKYEGTNLALNAAVTASRSGRKTGNLTGGVPSNAVDGDLLTSWSADTIMVNMTNILYPGPNDWLQVDLGSIKRLQGTAIYFEICGRVIGYKIETGKTANGPMTLVTDRTNNADTAMLYIGNVDYFQDSARYVRVTVTNLGNPISNWAKCGAMIREFHVFDSLSATSIQQAVRVPKGQHDGRVTLKTTFLSRNTSARSAASSFDLAGRRSAGHSASGKVCIPKLKEK